MSDMKKLQEAAKGISILYVEDNESLRKNAAKLLHKFFKNVYVGADGLEGLQLFKKYHPQLVISDIKMPKMDGITLLKKIKHIRPDSKLMFMSAFDEKEYLHEAIAVGAFRFLKKPVNVTELTDALLLAIEEFKHENHVKLFYLQLKNIFNYQSSMVVMLNNERPTIANQVFLDFFGVESTEDFISKYPNIGDLCMAHDGFLYNREGVECFEELFKNQEKLHHVKLKNSKDEIRHLILKLQAVPEKENHYIASFEDISDLKLLKLFDERASKNDENVQDTESMMKLLEVLKRNSAKIELHNYYKGLSITNDAIISDVVEGRVIVKTNFLQQKAIQFEKKSLIVSSALPHALSCETITNMSFEKRSVEFEALRFVKTSPVTRETIRVLPEDDHTASLFLDENKFQGDLSVEDISLDAVKLKLNALPAGFIEGTGVIIDMVLRLDNRPLIINTKATVFRKNESKRSFYVVLKLDLSTDMKSNLVKYITKRQMAIIREFKGLQNG